MVILNHTHSPTPSRGVGLVELGSHSHTHLVTESLLSQLEFDSENPAYNSYLLTMEMDEGTSVPASQPHFLTVP